MSQQDGPPKRTLSALFKKSAPATASSSSDARSTPVTLPTTPAPPSTTSSASTTTGSAGGGMASVEEYARAIASLTQQAKRTASSGGEATTGPSGSQTATEIGKEQREALSELAKRTVVIYRKSNSAIAKSYFQMWLNRTFNVPISAIEEMSAPYRLEGHCICNVLLDSAATHDRLMEQFAKSKPKQQEQFIIRRATEVAVESAMSANKIRQQQRSHGEPPQWKRPKTVITGAIEPPKSVDECWQPLLQPLIDQVKAISLYSAAGSSSSPSTVIRQGTQFMQQQRLGSQLPTSQPSMSQFSAALMSAGSGMGSSYPMLPTSNAMGILQMSSLAASMSMDTASLQQYMVSAGAGGMDAKTAMMYLQMAMAQQQSQQPQKRF